jgi:GT2 family glycosyltransferase/glycosyltransferase involved in cell wall biosynthesis
MNKLIVVIGMHRSGTSTVTRALKVMGVDLGDKMMPPVEGNNPKGFWEDLDINALNIEMLTALNSDWHYLAAIDTADVETLRRKGFFLRAVDLIRKKTGDSASFGFKDPRVTKLLPFWKEVINHCQYEASYILAVRHPLSVVKSLAKRDNFKEAKSYFLWLGHIIASLAGSSGKNRVLIDYDLLMQAPDHELERVAQKLELEINDAELQNYKTAFLDNSLQHTIYQPNDLLLDDACPPLVHEIYTKLLEVATDQEQIDAPAFQEKVEQWGSEFARLKSALKLVDKFFHQKEAADQSLAEWISSLNQAVSERDGQINNLKQTVDERDAQIANFKQIYARHDEGIANLNMALEERDMNIAALNEAITASDKQVVNLNMALEKRDMSIAALNEAIAASDKQIVNLNMALEEHDMNIAALNEAIAASDKQVVNLNMALEERDMNIAALNEAIAASNKQVVNLNQTVTQRDNQIENLKDEVVKRGEWALRLDGELQQARALLLKITQGNSWRITLPLREMRRWASTPKQQTRKYMQGGLRTAKRLYQSLPLQHQTKAAHRNTLATYFPKLLLASGAPPETIPSLAMPTTEQIASVQCAPPSTFLHSIEIPSSSNPLVSIIIPVFGQMSFTLRCLASIVANLPQASFEIIVVDDCSPDNSAEVLAAINGIRLIRNKQNCGFIRSCNAGASTAQGEYLHFLNNDTEVTPGWLDELLRTFREFPGTGLAGSKLIYPDGRLQEAGGIIWQDGSAWNFGRFQDPQLPVYNYAREVDYCSGASIMTPKKLFNELGGFDEHYLPAYCEDSDLALKIRDKGYRVIYQPLSTVIHYEGVTSGTDTTQGTKAYQVENSKKIYARWKNRLQSHQPAGTDIDNAKDRRAKRRVLVLDHCTPTPNQDSGSIDTYNIMLLLREMDFQVTFIPEDNFLFMPDYTTALQRIGIEVLFAPHITNVEQHLKDSSNRYELAILFRPRVADRHMNAIRKLCPKAKVIFHTVDLHFLRMMREAELNADQSQKKAAAEMKALELSLIADADIATVLSTQEFAMLSQHVPKGKIRLLPYTRYIEGTNKCFDERRDIVFVGGYQHLPNVDAVKYFVAEIMPLIRLRLPGVRFYAVGSNPPPEIITLACEDVIVTGFVEDLAPLLDKMRVSVAPLRYGAGIKGKIGSALSAGLPVVATQLAAEGMSLTDGENILVADGAEQFTDAIARIYQDKIFWECLSLNSLVFAENAWGAEVAWQNLATILSDLGLHAKRGAYPLSLYSESITPRSQDLPPICCGA